MRNVGKKSRKASAGPPLVSKSNSRYGALASPFVQADFRPAGSSAIARPLGPKPSTTRQSAAPGRDRRSAMAASRQFCPVDDWLEASRLDLGSFSPHGHRTWLDHSIRFEPVTRPGITLLHFPPASRVL